MDEKSYMQIKLWLADNRIIFTEMVVKKVQLEEQLKDTEDKIQFQRGVIAGLEKSLEIMDEMEKGRYIQQVSDKKLAGDDHQKKVAEHLDAKFEGKT